MISKMLKKPQKNNHLISQRDTGSNTFSDRDSTLRILFIYLLILAFAFPVRIWVPVGLFASFSVMDVVLVFGVLIVTHTIVSGSVNFRPISVLISLSMPVIFSFLSLLWTIDSNSTIKASLIYSEALVAYLLALVMFANMSPGIIVKYMFVFVVIIILTSIFSLMGFPGLEPQIPPDLHPGTPEYLSYVTSYSARLSHPYIGLSNNFSTVLAFFPIIFLSYSMAYNNKWYGYLSIICMFVVVLTFSRGVIAALIFSYILFIMKSQMFMKGLMRAMIISMFLLGGVLAYLSLNTAADRHFNNRFSSENVTGRLHAWQLGFEAISGSPIYGYGAGVPLVKGRLSIRNLHNTFLTQIYYFGWLGGLTIVICIVLLPRFVSRQSIGGDKARVIQRGVVFALVGQILIFVTQTSFEASVLRVIIYFLIGTSVMLIFASEREANMMVERD